MNIIINTPSAPQNPAAVTQKAYQMLYHLVPAHHQELLAFSAMQLRIGARVPSATHELELQQAADLLHTALENVLVGLNNPETGRHPKEPDVCNAEAFLRYLRSVIRSTRYELTRKAIRFGQPLPIDNSGPAGVEMAATVDQEEDPASRDFRDAFFERLGRELGDRQPYRRLIETWKENFFTGARLSELNIPKKLATKLRAKARKIYRRLMEPELTPA